MILKPDSGIDIAYWQRGIKIAALSPRPRFMIIKATEATTYKDSTTLDFSQQARTLGIPLGFYHFWRNVNPGAQADNYIQQVQAAGGFERIPPVLDLEINLTDQAGNVKTWLDRVTQAAGKLPILYGRGDIFDTLKQPAWFKDYDIWTAFYPANPDLYDWVPAPYAVTTGRREVIWQYAHTYLYPAYPATRIDTDIAIPEFLEEIGVVADPGDPVMTIIPGTANESLGKIPSIKSIPDVSGAKTGQLTAYCTGVKFDELVPGSIHPDDKWLKLTDGRGYVNQLVGGVSYFRITAMPIIVQDPPATTLPVLPVTVALGDDVTYARQTVTVNLQPLK